MMVDQGLSVLDFSVLLGALLQLALLTVIAHRMGHRGVWLAAPWVLSVVILVINATGTYLGLAQAGYQYPLHLFLVRTIPNATALPAFAMLVYLAIRGLRKQPTLAAETF